MKNTQFRHYSNTDHARNSASAVLDSYTNALTMSEWANNSAHAAQQAVLNGEGHHTLSAEELSAINNAYEYSTLNNASVADINGYQFGDGSLEANPDTTNGIIEAYQNIYGELPSDEMLETLVGLAAQEMMFGGSENLEAACQLVVEQYGAGISGDEAEFWETEDGENTEQGNQYAAWNPLSFIIDRANQINQQQNGNNSQTGQSGSGNTGGGSSENNDNSIVETTKLRNKILGTVNSLKVFGSNETKKILKSYPYNTIFLQNTLNQLSLSQLQKVAELLSSTSSRPIKVPINSPGGQTITIQPLKSLANQTGRQTTIEKWNSEHTKYGDYKKKNPSATPRDYIEASGRQAIQILQSGARLIPGALNACNIMAQIAVLFGQAGLNISEAERLDFAKWARFYTLVGSGERTGNEILTEKMRKEIQQGQRVDPYNQRIHGAEDHQFVNQALDNLRTGLEYLTEEQDQRLCQLFPAYKDLTTRAAFVRDVVNGNEILDANRRPLKTVIGENQYPIVPDERGTLRNNYGTSLGGNDVKGFTYYYDPGDLRNTRDGIAAYTQIYNRENPGANIPNLPNANASGDFSHAGLFDTLKNAGSNMANYVILIEKRHFVKVVGINSEGRIIVKDSNISPEIRILENNASHYNVYNYTPRQ